jgi:hypothetical protein
MPVNSVASPSQARLNERFARVLKQKKGPDAVMVGVLSVALVLGWSGWCSTSCGLSPSS